MKCCLTTRNEQRMTSMAMRALIRTCAAAQAAKVLAALQRRLVIFLVVCLVSNNGVRKAVDRSFGVAI